MTTEQTQLLMIISAKLQSTMHDIDRLVESNVKRELKQRCTGFLNYFEPMLSDTTKRMSQDGHIAFTELTRQFDRVGLEFIEILNETT